MFVHVSYVMLLVLSATVL